MERPSGGSFSFFAAGIQRKFRCFPDRDELRWNRNGLPFNIPTMWTRQLIGMESNECFDDSDRDAYRMQLRASWLVL